MSRFTQQANGDHVHHWVKPRWWQALFFKWRSICDVHDCKAILNFRNQEAYRA